MSERQTALSQKILVIISTFMMCTISFSLSAPTLLTNEDTVKAGPPTAGTTNLTVLNTTYLNGTQSYDDLYIGCGIVSCGSIVATGDLILSVNTLTVMNGASIIAYDQPTSTQGVGGSVQMSASYIGNGGGGAGHTSSGGNGGSSSSSGTTNNGGSSFGAGNETGSEGGTVSDSTGTQVSAGGIGGGRIVIYADVIEIYGTVDASGQDGEQGYTYQNGSGNGGSGAGAGSGGSIIMRANELTVGGSSGGSILAEGGNGGDGADGFCAPGSACIGLYHGGQGGGGGSGGAIDIRANSAANLMISSTSTISSSGGIGGSGGAPYGTGSSGSAGSSGGSGTANSGTWTGWSSSNPPPPTTSLPNPCIGAGTNAAGNIVADALEVNDAQSTASPASVLPISCTDLSLHSSTDVDFFEVQLVTGVTYYVNVTFSHAIQDVDVGWDDVNGTFLAAGTSVSDNELLTFTATQNVTSYVEVFPYIGFGGTIQPDYIQHYDRDRQPWRRSKPRIGLREHCQQYECNRVLCRPAIEHDLQLHDGSHPIDDWKHVRFLQPRKWNIQLIELIDLLVRCQLHP